MRYLDVNCEISDGKWHIDLVQEYVDGDSVRLLCEKGILPDLAPITERLLKAISYLHAINPKITHDYIKDGSIFLTKSTVYRIADFHLIPYLMHLKNTRSTPAPNDLHALGSLVEFGNETIQHYTKDFIKKCRSNEGHSNFADLLSHEFLSNAHIGHGNTIYNGPSLSHFMIEMKLGTGSFGTVFKVKHPNGQKRYALKLIELPDGSKGRYEKVKREVELLRGIQHPNVVEYVKDWEQVVNVTELGISVDESDSSSDE